MPRPIPPHKRETVYVKRSEIHVDAQYNYRRFVGGNLPGLGASLNKEGQTQAMLAVPWTGKTPYSLRDGFRRMKSVDSGFAKDFAKIDRFELVVITKPDGSPLTELEVQRICAATNSIRANWTPMEEATLFKAEIAEAIAVKTKAIGGALSAREERKIRSDVISALADDRKVSGRTIRYRLALLELPDPLQDSIARGLVTNAAIHRIIDAASDEEHMVTLLNESAKLANVNLDSEALPWEASQARSSREGGGRGAGRSTYVPVRAPRIQVRSVVSVLRRQGNPAVVVRPRGASDLKRELERMTTLATNGEADKKERAKAGLAWLRWFARQTDRMPV